MEHWKSAQDLLELFDVDCSRNGAQNFVELAELLGLMMAFPELGVNDHLLTRSYLRTLRMSPLVFWSRMKRDLARSWRQRTAHLRLLACLRYILALARLWLVLWLLLWLTV